MILRFTVDCKYILVRLYLKNYMLCSTWTDVQLSVKPDKYYFLGEIYTRG